MRTNTLLTTFATAGLLAGSAQAATVALYDFEQYTSGSTGETSPTFDSFDDRVFNPSTSLILPEGIASISDISFTVSDAIGGGQNAISTKGTQTYRWRLNGPVVTASFSVDIEPGYEIVDFALSLIQTGNSPGSFEVSYNGNTMGPSGTLDTDDAFDGDLDVYTSNTIAGPVSGTVDFVITVDPNQINRTSRWDNIQLTGDVVSAAPIPEPASLAVGLIGLSGLALRRRRSA